MFMCVVFFSFALLSFLLILNIFRLPSRLTIVIYCCCRTPLCKETCKKKHVCQNILQIYKSEFLFRVCIEEPSMLHSLRETKCFVCVVETFTKETSPDPCPLWLFTGITYGPWTWALSFDCKTEVGMGRLGPWTVQPHQFYCCCPAN